MLKKLLVGSFFLIYPKGQIQDQHIPCPFFISSQKANQQYFECLLWHLFQGCQVNNLLLPALAGHTP